MKRVLRGLGKICLFLGIITSLWWTWTEFSNADVFSGPLWLTLLWLVSLPLTLTIGYLVPFGILGTVFLWLGGGLARKKPVATD